jgi:predicted Fe-Mo cluster-binding NifX family protein
MKRVALLITVLLPFLTVQCVLAAENRQGRKIAVASNDRKAGSPVAERMGRSPFYLLFDRQGNFLKAVANPNFGKGPLTKGASGIDAVTFDDKGVMKGGIASPSREERQQTWNNFSRFFLENGISCVVAEEFGDEIVRDMKKGGIECVSFKGNADEAVRSIVKKSKN